MGSIYNVHTNPNRWIAFETGGRLKHPEYENEELLDVHFGSGSDDPCTSIDLSMLMRKSVYDRVMAGVYRVHPELTRQHCELVLVDENGNIIPPVKMGFCY